MCDYVGRGAHLISSGNHSFRYIAHRRAFASDAAGAWQAPARRFTGASGRFLIGSESLFWVYYTPSRLGPYRREHRRQPAQEFQHDVALRMRLAERVECRYARKAPGQGL
jgi:hypothetical protein